jgi:tetratricopeptide (TPR) repeat protein
VSLINQMLRDLENHKPAHEGGDRVRAVAARRSLRPLGLILVLLLAAAIAVLVLRGQVWPPDKAVPAPEVPIALAEPVITEPAGAESVPRSVYESVHESAPEPGRLIGLERVETRDGPRLRLDFDRETHHRRRAAADDRLVVELDAELPAEPDLPPGIAGLSHEPIGGDRIRLELELEPEWRAGPLVSAESPGDGERLLLALERRPSEPASGAASAGTEGTGTREPVTTVRADAQAEAGADTGVDAEPMMRRERRAPTDEERAQEAWAQAAEARAAGDLRTAAAALRRVLEHEPAHDRAREQLARWLAATGDRGGADRLLAEGVAVSARPGYLARLRARMWLEAGEPSRAVAALEAVWPQIDDSDETRALMAGLLYREGDHAAAREHYEALVESRPRTGTWWMGLGLAQEALGESSAAAAAYRRALEGEGLGRDARGYLEERIEILEARGGGRGSRSQR